MLKGNALPVAIGLTTLLMTPLWLQHVFSTDGGLIAIGGGQLSEADIFGSKKRPVKPAMHPVVFHVLAVAGLSNFALSALAIVGSYLGVSLFSSCGARVHGIVGE